MTRARWRLQKRKKAFIGFLGPGGGGATAAATALLVAAVSPPVDAVPPALEVPPCAPDANEAEWTMVDVLDVASI